MPQIWLKIEILLFPSFWFSNPKFPIITAFLTHTEPERKCLKCAYYCMWTQQWALKHKSTHTELLRPVARSKAEKPKKNSNIHIYDVSCLVDGIRTIFRLVPVWFSFFVYRLNPKPTKMPIIRMCSFGTEHLTEKQIIIIKSDDDYIV